MYNRKNVHVNKKTRKQDYVFLRGDTLMSLRPIHLIRFLLLFLCSFFLFPLAFSTKAFAAADPITVISESDVVHFPGSIDFTMTAKDTASSIVQAIIYITYKEPPYSFAKEHSITLIRPAQFVTVHWHEETSGDNFHTPGTPVEYNWVLQDSSNNFHTESPQDFKTLDTRYSWQHLSQGLLQVNWYNRPANFGQLLLNRANDSLNHISQTLGSGPLHPINLWVYASNQDFHGALAPGSYEWVGGEAHPALNEAFISAIDENDDTLVRDMQHELTHLVFHQLIAQGQQAPTWFDEGLAVYNQLYHEPEMKARFERALFKKSLLRLYTISDGFPSDSDQAYLAYAQSWNLISYMYTTFGQSKMRLLIKKMNDPEAGFSEDLVQAIGQDQDHLENQWRLHLGQPGILLPNQVTPTPRALVQTSQTQTSTTDSTAPVFITAGSVLILLPIIGIVAILVYQRRKRQQALAAEAVQHYQPVGQLPLQRNTNSGYAGPLQYRPATPAIEYPTSPQQMYYPPYQASSQQPGHTWGNQGPSPQTYMPFPSFVPEQAFGAPPASPPVQPAPMPPRLPIQPQPAPPAIGEEEGDDGADSMLAPFGPFNENVNQQPQKKAPQE
jgi:hypothetical protein